MKILLVVPEFPPDHGGGIITFYRELAPALKRAGAEVKILKGSAAISAPQGQNRYEYQGIPVEVLETERYRKWQKRFAHYGMFRTLQNHLAAAYAIHEQVHSGAGFDVVEICDWGLTFAPWMAESAAPVLVQMHGSMGQIAHHEPVAGAEAESLHTLILERALLPFASGICTLSKANAEWWGETLGGSCHYIPPALDLPQPPPSEVPPTGYLCLGRIQKWKGPQVACRAWQLLGDKAPSLHWLGRDTRAGCNGVSTSEGLAAEFPGIWGKSIEPMPPVHPTQVPAVIRDARAVVIPSSWDVFNFVAAEAMCLGKIVIVSQGAGVSGLITHGHDGFTFPVDDAASLASCVAAVEAMTPDARAAMGQAAATTAHRLLGPETIAAQKIEHYASLAMPTAKVQTLARRILPAPLEHSYRELSFLDSLGPRSLLTHGIKLAVSRLLKFTTPKNS
ncbi:MAG: glycosyltransferase family 4 protein [Verrucomicrobiota bacterium]